MLIYRAVRECYKLLKFSPRFIILIGIFGRKIKGLSRLIVRFRLIRYSSY